MKQGVLSANSSEWLTFRTAHAPPNLLKRNGFRAHGVQTRNQESRAETLAIDLAVYLVWRLVDSHLLEHSRKLLIANATSHHLDFNQLLRGLLPSLVRLSLPRALAVRCIHHSLSAVRWLSHTLVRTFSHNSFQSYTTDAVTSAIYVLSKIFFEEKMLRNTSTNRMGSQMPNSGARK